MLSIPHLIIIFVVALVIFGPEKLPELARNLGKVMAEFRRATGDLRSTFEGHLRDIEREAETRRIGGGDGTAAGGASAADAAAPSPSPNGPHMVAAEGTVPSNAPNAPAIAAGEAPALFRGEEEIAAEPGSPVTPASAAVPPKGSSEPEQTYDHVSDGGFSQS